MRQFTTTLQEIPYLLVGKLRLTTLFSSFRAAYHQGPLAFYFFTLSKDPDQCFLTFCGFVLPLPSKYQFIRASVVLFATTLLKAQNDYIC